MIPFKNKPRPHYAPPSLAGDLVSTRIDTNYDAVSKLKQGYKQIVDRLKTALKTPFSSIETSVGTLNSLTIDTTTAVPENDFVSLKTITGDDAVKAQAVTITKKIATQITKEAINTAIKAGNSVIISIDSSNIAQIPALAKQLAEYKLDDSSIVESAFDNLKSTITADAEDRPKVAKEIAAELIENIVSKTLDAVQAIGNRIVSLASTSKTTIDQVANELDEEMIVVNDLWSIKDHQIANLEAQRNKAVEELNNLQLVYDDLKKKYDELAAQAQDTIEQLLESQNLTLDEQKETATIIKSATAYSMIDAKKLREENL
jgi:archaellum component FlaC